MPYDAGQRLPAERASRLGHLEVLKSDLVRKLCNSFEDSTILPSPAFISMGTYSFWEGSSADRFRHRRLTSNY